MVTYLLVFIFLFSPLTFAKLILSINVSPFHLLSVLFVFVRISRFSPSFFVYLSLSISLSLPLSLSACLSFYSYLFIYLFIFFLGGGVWITKSNWCLKSFFFNRLTFIAKIAALPLRYLFFFFAIVNYIMTFFKIRYRLSVS